MLTFAETVALRNKKLEALNIINDKIKLVQAPLVDREIDYDERIGRIKERRNELGLLLEQRTKLEIERKVIANNLLLILYKDVMPTIVEVLNSFEGKAYGPKTSEKIKKIILEKTECSIWIEESYTDKIHVHKTYSCNFECGLKGNKKILVGNKIQHIDIEELEIWYVNSAYIDDTEAYAEQIINIHKEAEAKQKELEEICSRYNRLAVNGINHIYIGKTIYSLF